MGDAGHAGGATMKRALLRMLARSISIGGPVIAEIDTNKTEPADAPRRFVALDAGFLGDRTAVQVWEMAPDGSVTLLDDSFATAGL